jgi:tetratricopeptide (TPR) repeat protein
MPSLCPRKIVKSCFTEHDVAYLKQHKKRQFSWTDEAAPRNVRLRMEEVSVLSTSSAGLSSASSRTEHMAYLTESLGLDSGTAALLYRAERLQEKGQYKMALKYYQKVLQAKPDCLEAAENARITKEMLKEQHQGGALMGTCICTPFLIF